jgi:hypothetical protein
MRAHIFAFAAAMLVATPAFAGGPMGWFDPGTDGPMPHNGRPAHHLAMPRIRDWSSLKITLTRSICFGSCPAYTVEIDGDGTVIYNGERFVAETGERAAHISRHKVRALYNAFRKAQFFWLFGKYQAHITDFPSYTVSIAYDGHEKKVLDYAGPHIGMPQAVVDLELLIDKTAGTDRWIKAPQQ